MSLKNKLISAVLCAATLFSLAGCTFGKDFGTVATVTGDGQTLEYTAGYYLYYQYSGFTSAVSALGSDAETKVSAILKQNLTVDEKEVPVRDYIEQQRDHYLIMHGAIDAWYEKEGLSFTDSILSTIKTQASSGWSSYMEDMLRPNGISYDNYYSLVENYYKEQALFEKYYGEDSKDILSESDIDEALKEGFIRAEVVRFPKVDAKNNALSDDAKNQIEALVKKAVEAIQAGKSTEAVIDEYMPQVLKLSTKADYTKAADYITEEYLPIEGSGYADALMQLMVAAETGDAGYRVDTRNVYFFVKGDVLEKDDMYKAQAEESETAAREAAFAEDVEEYMEGFKVTYNQEAVEYFDPKNIKY